MPVTEPCILGTENKIKIEGLEKMLGEFKGEVREDINHIASCVNKITNHYSKKPSWAITTALIILSNLVVALALYVITR